MASKSGPATSTKSQRRKRNNGSKRSKIRRADHDALSSSPSSSPSPTPPSRSSSSVSASEDSSSDAASSSASESSSSEDESSQWTVSEDGILEGMRKDKAAWSKIASTLRRREDECQRRWQTLTKSSRRGRHDTKQSKSRRRGETKKSDKAAAATTTTTTEEAYKPAKTKNSEPTPADPQRKDKKPSGPRPPPLPKIDPAEDYRQQQEYLYGTIYPQLYPSIAHVQPDEYLSHMDAVILSRVIDMTRETMLLRIQATFFNITGRMVPLHILADKCQLGSGGGGGGGGGGGDEGGNG